MMDKQAPKKTEFKSDVDKQKELENVSSLIEDTQKKPEEDQVIFKDKLIEEFKKFTTDDTWYELYKSITNEKDMAEKDQ